MEQRAIDELFERNADMRLLELRHASAGASPALKHATSTFGAESVLTKREELELDRTPRLRVAIAGAPQTGLIPGAVVGVAIDVFNDGNAPAPESKLFLALPHECQYRGGTLRVDGREPVSGDQLFSNGLPIARLPGETSSKVTFQVVVLPGIGALYLQPRLQTDGVPVVGTPGISLKRLSTSTAAAPERPFYELEAEETKAEALPEQQQAILPPVVPPPLPAPPLSPRPKAAVASPVPQTPWPAQRPSPPPAPVRAPVPTAVPVPAPVAAAPAPAVADEVMVRYRSLAASDVALLERLFAPAVPGLVAHYLAISSIACCETSDGRDAGGSAAFLRGDIEALARSLVAARMGKPLGYRVDQIGLEALGLEWQPDPAAAGPRAGIRLRRDIRRSEYNAIAGLLQRSARDATLRLRIALLALVGATLEGVSSELADRCMAALTSYRSALLAWLVPLCVASNANAAFTIPAPPEAVDAAARRAIGALKEAFPG